eukprot:Gb_25831 [translate_table: standard]
MAQKDAELGRVEEETESGCVAILSQQAKHEVWHLNLHTFFLLILTGVGILCIVATNNLRGHNNFIQSQINLYSGSLIAAGPPPAPSISDNNISSSSDNSSCSKSLILIWPPPSSHNSSSNNCSCSPPPQPPSSQNFSGKPIPQNSSSCKPIIRQAVPLRFQQWIKPPKLQHNMTDEELEWRASMVPHREGYPYKRVPKIAFMFLTRGPLPLMPLWDKFFQEHHGLYSVFVHALPSYKLRAPSTSPFHGRQIPSQDVSWGEPSMGDAERRLLANALLDFSNERFVLLSESCIPVFNFSTVYDYLMNSQESFVNVFDDPGYTGRGRYNEDMKPDITIEQWRKGSQWFEVDRRLALHIISDTKYYSIFKAACLPPCYLDEHYLPTFVSMQFGFMNSARSLTWVDWSRGGPHPATFGMEDITEEFMRSIRDGNTCTYHNQTTNLCVLFARKFSQSALEPLLQLSSTVLGF